MAVRFIQPVDTPYESQFIPMPLEFMQQNLETKQKGLDTARTQLGTADFKIDNAPWDAENAQTYRDEFGRTISELTSNLEQNKGSYGQTVSQLGALNRKFNTDPELQRIKKHYEAYQANVAPYMGKPNAASLYFRNLMEQDPTTGQWGWRDASEITEADIVTPIEDKVETTVSTELLSYLKPSIKDKYGEGKFSYDEKGKLIWLKPDGTKITDLNLDNPYIKSAIDTYSQRILEGTADQYLYIKEFKGLNTLEDIKNLVTGIASKGFYRNIDVTPGKTSKLGGSGRGGGDTDEKSKDYNLDMFNWTNPLDTDYGSQYSITAEQATEAEIKKWEVVADHVQQINKSPEYAPRVQQLLTGPLEVFTDNVIAQRVEAIKQSNMSNAEKQRAITDLEVWRNLDNTALGVLTEPFNYFKEGGKLEEQGFTPEEVDDLESTFFNSLIALRVSGNASTADLDVANAILQQYKAAKDADELRSRQESIFQESAKQMGIDEEELAESFRDKELVAKYSGFGPGYWRKYERIRLAGYLRTREESAYTKKQVESEPELQELLRKGYLTYYEDENVFKFVEGEDGNSLPQAFENLINTSSLYNDTANEITEKEREQSFIREGGIPGKSERGAIGTFSTNLLESIQKNPEILLRMGQEAAGGDGKASQNMPTIEDMLESANSEFNTSDDYEFTDLYLNASSTGTPMATVVAKDSENNVAYLDILINDESQLPKMLKQMASDDNPAIRDVAAGWATNLMFPQEELSLLDMSFDMLFDKNNLGKGTEPISIESNNGVVYKLRKTAQGTVKITYTDLNGNEQIPSAISNNKGEKLDPNNIQSASHARQYIGYLGLKGLTGGQGGSSMGKSQKPQLGERR